MAPDPRRPHERRAFLTDPDAGPRVTASSSTIREVSVFAQPENAGRHTPLHALRSRARDRYDPLSASVRGRLQRTPKNLQAAAHRSVRSTPHLPHQTQRPRQQLSRRVRPLTQPLPRQRPPKLRFPCFCVPTATPPHRPPARIDPQPSQAPPPMPAANPRRLLRASVSEADRSPHRAQRRPPACTPPTPPLARAPTDASGDRCSASRPPHRSTASHRPPGWPTNALGAFQRPARPQTRSPRAGRDRAAAGYRSAPGAAGPRGSGTPRRTGCRHSPSATPRPRTRGTSPAGSPTPEPASPGPRTGASSAPARPSQARSAPAQPLCGALKTSSPAGTDAPSHAQTTAPSRSASPDAKAGRTAPRTPSNASCRARPRRSRDTAPTPDAAWGSASAPCQPSDPSLNPAPLVPSSPPLSLRSRHRSSCTYTRGAFRRIDSLRVDLGPTPTF